MPREKSNVPTRQLYAQIREDLYLGAKARAAEMRMPLREFIEYALAAALDEDGQSRPAATARSVWDDEYLSMQARQPFGSPIELTDDEVKSILREAVGRK